MKRTIALLASLAAALAIAACNGTTPNVPSTISTSVVPHAQRYAVAMPACSTPAPGHAQCLALIQSNSGVSPDVAGWAPADLQARYNLPSSTKGAGQIVAIVDAYDNPNVASDLATYRTNFGLGTAHFTKYNQRGKTKNYPAGSPGWGVEIDLDVEMVSAACPKCTIYLIEANSSNSSDLDAAEVEAIKLGAHIISNSFICYGSICDNPKDFSTPGVMYLAGSGDNGYNNEGSPMALASVVSVGGTVLNKVSNNYSEIVWAGSGSGCATGITKPSWQHDSGCTARTDNDVAAIADGVAEYDSYQYGGWFTVGGTSVASPFIGGVFGLAGNASKFDAGKQFWTDSARKHKQDFHDITSGSDGACGGTYLCTGIKGYDGPTGWGTPNGINAF